MPKGKTSTDTDREPTPSEAAYSLFLVSREAQNVTSQTLASYHRKLYPFITWCTENGAALVDAVTADHVRLYLAYSGTGPDTPVG